MKDYIGRYVKRFESGDLSCFAFGRCGDDWGLSCGTNQRILRYGIAIGFLKTHFPENELVKKLYFNYDMPDLAINYWPGEQYCSSPDDLKAAWLSCIEEVGKEEFERIEHEDILENYYSVAKEELNGLFDVEKNRAFQEMTFAGSIFCGAVAYANRIKNILHTYQNDEQFFDAIYDTLYKEYPWERWADASHTSYLPNSERETLRPLLKEMALKEGGCNMITLENIEQKIQNFPAEPGVYRDRIINGKVGSLKDVKAIVVHYTGVPGQTAKGNAEYFGRVSGHPTDPYLSIHYIVDENEIWSCVPLDKRAGHCEDAGVGQFKNQYNNSNTIGIEVCPHHTSGKKYPEAQEKTWYFKDATVNNLSVLVAYLIKKVEIASGSRPAIVRHYDITNKWCPAPFLDYGGNDWEAFKADVMNRISASNSAGKPTNSTNNKVTMTGFWYCDGTVTINCSVNAYSNAKLSSKIAGVLAEGAKYRAVQGIQMSDGTDWYRLETGAYVQNCPNISYADNNMKRFVVAVNSPDGVLNLRDFPNSDIGNVKKTLKNGDLMEVHGEAYNNGDHWYLVDQGNASNKFKGFVAARYIK